jgi:L-carnitine CoA-transferase
VLAAHDVPCASVVAMEDVPSNPQVIANRTLVEYSHPVLGRIRQPRPVPGFPGVVGENLAGAPRLGADTSAVLGELGFDDQAIAGLVRDGVVGQWTEDC